MKRRWLSPCAPTFLAGLQWKSLVRGATPHTHRHPPSIGPLSHAPDLRHQRDPPPIPPHPHRRGSMATPTTTSITSPNRRSSLSSNPTRTPESSTRPEVGSDSVKTTRCIPLRPTRPGRALRVPVTRSLPMLFPFPRPRWRKRLQCHHGVVHVNSHNQSVHYDQPSMHPSYGL